MKQSSLPVPSIIHHCADNLRQNSVRGKITRIIKDARQNIDRSIKINPRANPPRFANLLHLLLNHSLANNRNNVFHKLLFQALLRIASLQVGGSAIAIYRYHVIDSTQQPVSGPWLRAISSYRPFLRSSLNYYGRAHSTRPRQRITGDLLRRNLSPP